MDAIVLFDFENTCEYMRSVWIYKYLTQNQNVASSNFYFGSLKYTSDKVNDLSPAF